MGFSAKLQYYLVHHCNFTNAQASGFIRDGRISVNKTIVTENVLLDETSEICFDDKVLRQARTFTYLAFHKPRGFVSSLNVSEKDNLGGFFPAELRLSIAGRLDKDSEGLLLLSDDGKWVEKICQPLNQKVKIYVVDVDIKPDQQFVEAFYRGIQLKDGTHTLGCRCEIISDFCFRVWLTEGKYRQIRRMCHVLGRKVMRLQRIEIAGISLGNLAPGKNRPLTFSELTQI